MSWPATPNDLRTFSFLLQIERVFANASVPLRASVRASSYQLGRKRRPINLDPINSRAATFDSTVRHSHCEWRRDFIGRPEIRSRALNCRQDSPRWHCGLCSLLHIVCCHLDFMVNMCQCVCGYKYIKFDMMLARWKRENVARRVRSRKSHSFYGTHGADDCGVESVRTHYFDSRLLWGVLLVVDLWACWWMFTISMMSVKNIKFGFGKNVLTRTTFVVTFSQWIVPNSFGFSGLC